MPVQINCMHRRYYLHLCIHNRTQDHGVNSSLRQQIMHRVVHRFEKNKWKIATPIFQKYENKLTFYL